MLDLCTLNEFKIYKQIPLSNDKEDDRISALINQVSLFIKQLCGRSFNDYVDSPKVEYYNAISKNRVFLTEFPIINISSVEVSTDGGVTYTSLVENTDYFVDEDTASILSAYTSFIEYGIPHKNLKITYTAGFNEVPADIKQAAMDLVEYYRNEEYTPRKMFDKVQVENLGFREGGAGSDLPKHIKRILEMYRAVY